jgi:hypothetical protein
MGLGVIDRGFVRALDPEPGEVIRWQGGAIFRAPRTGVGGRLFVTDRRVVWCPGYFSRRQYEAVRIPFSTIAGIDVLGRTRAVSEGGLRRRVRVRLTNGEERLFTMPRPDERAALFQSLVDDPLTPGG